MLATGVMWVMKMGKNIKEQINILTLVNIVLAVMIILVILGIYSVCINPNSNTMDIAGDIVYIKSISDPTNSSKGVWLKITLDNPKKTELTQIRLGADLANEKRVYFNFRSDNFTATHGNYTAQFYDRNNDGYVSSGDEFHIYGDVLENADFYFYVSGYNGELRERI